MNLSAKAPDWTGHTNEERLAHALHTLHEAGIIHDHERNTHRQRLRAIERVQAASRRSVEVPNKTKTVAGRLWAPKDLIECVAKVSHAVALQAGVCGRETAGAIISFLADKPEYIEPFYTGGIFQLPKDWLTSGCLSWRANNGEIVHPEQFREVLEQLENYPVPCTKCDDTGYKDHAGFAMDPCDHAATEMAGT